MGRKKSIFLLTSLIVLIIFTRIFFQLHINPYEEDFIYVKSCPACYGKTLCHNFYHKDVNLLGISKLKYLRSSKNVYTARLFNEKVILKKLAHDWEIKKSDNLVCHRANLSPSCDVSNAMKTLVKKSFGKAGDYHFKNLVHSFNGSTDVSHCPSQRLLTYIFNKIDFKPENSTEILDNEIYKIGEMLYSLLVNPEALILQAFPQVEGWPFPQYYGSCGRVIVEEYVGKTISNYEDSSLKLRMNIAYQLLLIAQTLTENDLDFALYMTDVNLDNFAVKSDGTVLLVDVESIIIVDRQISRKNKKYLGALHHSKGEFCKDCLNFSFDDLCSYDLSDHNYYAICKGLLVPDSYYSSKGLLHGISSEVSARTNITDLLKECADPSKPYSRFSIVPKILQVLKSLL